MEPEIGQTDADAVPDAAPQRCSPGDVWQLGAHRLLCGDATDDADVIIEEWEDFTGKVASKVEAAPLKEVA